MRHHVNRDRFYPDHLHAADVRDGAPTCPLCDAQFDADGECKCTYCGNCGVVVVQTSDYCAACRRDPTCLGYEAPIALPEAKDGDLARLFGRTECVWDGVL